MKYLGSSYDIHVGGVELVFPHHEAEIAQGEALSGKRPFVRYWVHTGMLNVNGTKMSKSLGNVLRIRDALASYTPEELRFVFANTNYRRTASYSRSQLLQARSKLRAMREAVRRLGACSSKRGAGKHDMRLLKELSRTEAGFISAMEDDFDTPRALKALYRFLTNASNQARSGNELNAGTCEAVLRRVRALANMAGLVIA
jgi:cysteinyl-tRNA synthetase